MAKGLNTVSSQDDWQTEDDLRTLARAEEIKGDKKRYKAALALAKTKIQDLQDLQDDAVTEGPEEAKEAKK